MQHFVKGCSVEAKADASPVTAADRDAEALILSELAKLYPDIPVLAEESVAAGHVPALGETFFVVDPLDGTKEFVNQRTDFTVNIALVTGGTPVMGVVYAPAISAIFVAEASDKSWTGTVDPGCPLPAIRFPIKIRSAATQGLTALVSRSHDTPETEAYLAKFPIAERISAGSSLKFCRVAEGKADIYPRFGPTMEWDTAAGDAVLRGAGGCVLDLDSKALTYGNSANKFRNPDFIAYGDVVPVKS